MLEDGAESFSHFECIPRDCKIDSMGEEARVRRKVVAPRKLGIGVEL
jgi:hypothetical protein